MVEEQPEGGTSGRFERMGKKMDQRLGGAVPRLEDEVRKLIAYLDGQVVPVLRKNSSSGLRAAAERMRALADRLERAQGSSSAGEQGTEDPIDSADPADSADSPADSTERRG